MSKIAEEIIFVSDFFSDQLLGGAELTFDALIEDCTVAYKRVNSNSLTKKDIDNNSKNYWIFGNTSLISDELRIYISKNIRYSVINFDYKFCDYRSIEIHRETEKKECDCEIRRNGKIYSIFLAKAENLWWMSRKQQEIFHNKFSFLKKNENYVLSSVFSKKTLNAFNQEKIIEKNDTYLIINSNSWVKGYEESIKYAKEKKIKYEVLKDLKHEEILKKFSLSKGLIFLPKGGDTCPRITIEALMFGCDLILNDNVQHKDEEWFANKESALTYLSNQINFFWKKTNEKILNQNETKNLHFKIVVTCRNAQDNIKKTIDTIKNQTYDNYECVISDDFSEDSTCDIVKEEIYGDPRFKLIKNNKQVFPCENTKRAIEACSDIKDEDIIFVLGGDDWLPSEIVLSRLNYHYNKEDCWCTFGSWKTQDGEKDPFYMRDYEKSVKELNDFRNAEWLASSPRTFKYFLWKKIVQEDLLDNDLEYYKQATDFAYFIPILEMSGHKSLYVKDILYVYNRSTPLNMDKIYPGKQLENEIKIRKKKRYKPLDRTIQNWSIACITYNDSKNLEKFIFSCLGIEGLNDIFVIDHRSDDDTQDVLNKMKKICGDYNIDLRWEYCQDDFNKDFTMADLRLKSVKGCKNNIVSIQDADNLLGPNMTEIIRVSSDILSKNEVFGVAYPLPVVYENISFSKEGRVVKHGDCIVHPPIPRILSKDLVKCEQVRQNGRYYWWGSDDKRYDKFSVINYVPSSNISVSIRDKERQKLRSVMGDYFEKIKNNETTKSYLESYRDGDLGIGGEVNLEECTNQRIVLNNEFYRVTNEN